MSAASAPEDRVARKKRLQYLRAKRWRENNREWSNKLSRRQREKDPEHRREIQRRYERKNAGLIRERRRQADNKRRREQGIPKRVFLNLDKEGMKRKNREHSRRSYARDKARWKRNAKAWRLANWDKYLASEAGRRSRKHPLRNRSKIAAIYSEAARLTRSTGIKHAVDHIIPVSENGWHHELNLQILTDAMNSSKNANPFWFRTGFKSWRDVPRSLWPENLRAEYLYLSQCEQ